LYSSSFKIRNFSCKCCRPANLVKESFCLEGILPSTSTSTNCLWFLIYLSFVRLFVCLFVCSFVCSFVRTFVRSLVVVWSKERILFFVKLMSKLGNGMHYKIRNIKKIIHLFPFFSTQQNIKRILFLLLFNSKYLIIRKASSSCSK
jgi:hypothetical protein